MAVRDRPPAEAVTPPAQDLALLGFALIGASIAPALIAATTAPAIAVAFWRNVLSLPVVRGVAVARHELPRLRGRALGLAVLGGALLGAHFAAFTPSLRYTSVAARARSSARRRSGRACSAGCSASGYRRRAWLGVGVALAGVLTITGVDFRSPAAR